MNLWNIPKASLLPALLLGLLVLFTFGTLQNYGPESTLRKFHASLHNIYVSQANNKGIPMNDWNDLRSTLIEDIGTPGQVGDAAALSVIQKAWSQFQAGASYSLARTDRSPREVRIAVLYSVKSQQTPMVWVIDKPQGGREWKISARKTLSAMSVP